MKSKERDRVKDESRERETRRKTKEIEGKDKNTLFY